MRCSANLTVTEMWGESFLFNVTDVKYSLYHHPILTRSREHLSLPGKVTMLQEKKLYAVPVHLWMNGIIKKLKIIN